METYNKMVHQFTMGKFPLMMNRWKIQFFMIEFDVIWGKFIDYFQFLSVVIKYSYKYSVDLKPLNV